MIQAGQTIHATTSLAGDYFERAFILLVKHDTDESIGFITNRPFGKSLAELEEFRDTPPVPLWEGGPVGQDHLYMVHKRPDLISGGTRIGNGLYWGGSMDELVAALQNDLIHADQFQLFIGYCGWDAGELAQELNGGSWRAH